jgi:hypothetical protein
LKVMGSSDVSYYISGIKYDFVPYSCRLRPIPEVQAAADRMEKEVILNLEIILHLKPADHGQTTETITGRWVTCINNRDMPDIRMITQVPLSGWMLKQRLQQHEAWAARVLAAVQDAEVKKILNRVIESMRAAASQLPDGLLHHAYCIAYITQDKQYLPTILMDEEPVPAKSVAPALYDLKKAAMRFNDRGMVSGGGSVPGFADSRLRLLERMPPGALRYGTGKPDLHSAGIDGSKPKWSPFGH